MRTAAVVLAILAPLALPAAARADVGSAMAPAEGPPGGEAGSDHEDGARRLPASACAAVFGDEAARAENALHREDVLRAVHQGRHAIDVVHATDPGEPRPVRFEGLRLVETSTDEGLAVVELEAGDDVGCEPVLYVVGADDGLGDAHVLAVLDGLLLLEEPEGLVYLRAEDGPAPTFRMSWASACKVWKPRFSGKATVTKKKSRSRRRR